MQVQQKELSSWFFHLCRQDIYFGLCCFGASSRIIYIYYNGTDNLFHHPFRKEAGRGEEGCLSYLDI